MKNKKEIILSVVGIVLVVSLVLGLVIFVSKTSDTSVTPKDTSASTSTDLAGDDTSLDNVVAPLYHQVDDIAYRTVDNVTTFYIVVEPPEWPDLTHPDYDDFYDTWSCMIIKEKLDLKGLADLKIKKSYDDGYLWSDTDNDFALDGNVGSAQFGGLEKGKSFCISFAEIEDCADPVTKLLDFKNKIFDKKEFKENSTGAYYIYSSFPISKFVNKKTPVSFG